MYSPPGPSADGASAPGPSGARRVLIRWAAPLRQEMIAAWREPLLRNGHFLTMSSAGTAALGLLYWSLAAHRYSPMAVGRSSAVVSAMMLIGGVAQLNLISALVRFVPLAGPRTRALVVTSYLTAGTVAAALGLAFVSVAPALSNQFRFVTAQPWMAAGLVVLSSLWAIFVLQDSVLTGLRQTIVVAAENAVFAMIKIAAVVALSTILRRDGIVVSWWVGLALAVLGTNLYLFRLALPPSRSARPPGTEPVSLRMVARFAAPDYVGGLCWLAVTTATPLLVLARVGPTRTAYFTVAWQFGIALFALSANMGASLVVETATDQTNLPQRWRRIVRHSLLPLVAAVIGLEVAAPMVLRLFGRAYAENGSALLRLLVLAALPNLITETAVFAARAQRRTVTAAVILTSVSVGILGLTALLLPHLGIAAVGVACLSAETLVALVLWCRPGWWLGNRVPVRSGLRPALLGATMVLMVTGTVLLAVGLAHEAASDVLASLLCNGGGLVPLAVFLALVRGRDGAAARSPLPPAPTPIEGYDQLRIDEILPLLQELEPDRLDVVRLHEMAGRARPSILCRIEDLGS